jgi:hypothetical protein
MWQGGQPRHYDKSKGYVSIMISDGDNIAEDWAALRPMLEERVLAKSTVPGKWGIETKGACLLY